MHQQYLNSASSQLNFMSADELREIFNDEEKLDERIDSILKSLETEKDVIINDNRSLAESNLEQEPKLIELRSRINDLTSEGKELSQTVQEKLTQMKSKSSNMSPEIMLDILKASAAESEEASDKTAEDFMDGAIAIDEFLEQFKPKRAEMHLRKLKADKMQELLRHGPSNVGPQPYPPMSNFYGPPGSGGGVPYPMPGGNMMPMPSIYRSPY